MYKTIYLSELTSKVDNDACFKQNMHQSQAYCCLTKYPKSRVLVGETCVFSTTKSSVAHTRIIHNSTFLYLKGTPISNVKFLTVDVQIQFYHADKYIQLKLIFYT